MRKGQYLSLQAGGVQDRDLRPTAGPHGVLQAQQRADGPRPHCQAHGRALQVPGHISWEEKKTQVKAQGSSARGSHSLQRGPGLLHKPSHPVPWGMVAVPICLHLWPTPWGLDSPLLFLSFPLSPGHSSHIHLPSR